MLHGKSPSKLTSAHELACRRYDTEFHYIEILKSQPVVITPVVASWLLRTNSPTADMTHVSITEI